MSKDKNDKNDKNHENVYTRPMSEKKDIPKEDAGTSSFQLKRFKELKEFSEATHRSLNSVMNWAVEFFSEMIISRRQAESAFYSLLREHEARFDLEEYTLFLLAMELMARTLEEKVEPQKEISVLEAIGEHITRKEKGRSIPGVISDLCKKFLRKKKLPEMARDFFQKKNSSSSEKDTGTSTFQIKRFKELKEFAESTYRSMNSVMNWVVDFFSALVIFQRRSENPSFSILKMHEARLKLAEYTLLKLALDLMARLLDERVDVKSKESLFENLIAYIQKEESGQTLPGLITNLCRDFLGDGGKNGQN